MSEFEVVAESEHFQIAQHIETKVFRIAHVDRGFSFLVDAAGLRELVELFGMLVELPQEIEH